MKNSPISIFVVFLYGEDVWDLIPEVYRVEIISDHCGCAILQEDW